MPHYDSVADQVSWQLEESGPETIDAFSTPFSYSIYCPIYNGESTPGLPYLYKAANYLYFDHIYKCIGRYVFLVKYILHCHLKYFLYMLLGMQRNHKAITLLNNIIK